MIRDTVKTTRGRVVYDRKKHEFGLDDILRIMKKKNSELGIISVLAENWNDTVDCIIQTPGKESGTDSNIPTVEFGAGEFGGAGGSRSFDSSVLYSADYIVISKKS